MFDVAFCAPPPVYFSSHVDDVKADVWMVFFTATITLSIPSLVY